MKHIFIFLLSISYIFSSSALKDLYYSSKSNDYLPATKEDFKSSLELFKMIINKETNSTKIENKLYSLGFELDNIDDLIIIRDKFNRGWGFYILRLEKSRDIMLSIPHRFSDLGSGNIGYKLMLDYPFKAIAFNTTNRKIKDIAHSENTIFNAFHLAFTQTYPKASLYQLHGFAQGKRKNKDAQSTNIILSNTTSNMNGLKKIYDCTHIIGDYNVKIFGKDIFELGGTNNKQASILKSTGYSNFIHIELDKSFRDALLKDKILLKKFQSCLL
jgi:hypothetical protein